MNRLGKTALVRRALDVIRRTLRQHPELRQRTADYLDGTLPERSNEHDDEKETDPHHRTR